MSFIPAQAAEFTSTITQHVRLSSRYFLLRVTRPSEMNEPVAGSFVNVAVPDPSRFFLRRPFSLLDCIDNYFDLLVVEVGDGTTALRRLCEGDPLTFYGPLGSGFPKLGDKNVVAVGGGVGLAPLYYYGVRGEGASMSNYRLLYGARTSEDLFLDHIDLEALGVLLSTDDGSHGFRGNVVELARAEVQKQGCDALFSCGPTVMMRAVQSLAEELGVPHYVSLENRMACALGACRACVVPTRLDGDSPYRTVCHDGPVFDGADLEWADLPTP